ncbi:MAG: RHS repeat protein [Planctomycetes bacterium]|nr:RHS repeat protein [Planctomycetota bacterium]
MGTRHFRCIFAQDISKTTTGKIGTITLPRLNSITYGYDALDRLTSIRDALGNTVNYTYDSSGQRTKEEIKDAGGVLQKTVSFQYDVLNRLAQVVNPDSTFTAYGYDAAGNQTSVTNPRTYATSSVYDALNRLVRTTQPGSVATAYGYDGQDHLTSVTDANNHATTYVYDDQGRVYREVSPDTGTTTYTYDPAGNRTSKTDARNITVSYSYDALNRLTKVDFPTDTDITYSYDTCTDGKGRLCGVVDQAGTTNYAYSAKGQLTQETKVIQGVTYVTGYGYDSNGNLASITYPSGRLVNYSYDLADRVSSVTTTPPGGVAQTVATTIAHKPSGGIAWLTYGNGLTRTVTYDQQYRITAIKTPGIQDLGYTLDANGNITAIANNLDATKNKGFGYDGLDRLTGATGPWGSLGWTYDGAGNRLTQTAPEGSSTYTYQSGNNRLASVSGSQPKTFDYDANGNTILENSRTYTYSQNNRRIQAAEGSILGEYAYNGKEQRLTKTVGGQVTIFHHDQAGQILAESQASGVTTTEYIYMNGEPIAKAEGATLSFIHTDHLGTPLAMTDAAGAKVWEIVTRPFGDGATITGTASLNLRFPGQYVEAETGVHQNWHRDYGPTLGRYLEADPLGSSGAILFHGAAYDALDVARFLIEDGTVPSLYSYADNRPLLATDPMGLCTLSPKMECCLEDIFGKPVKGVRLVSKPKKNPKWAAKTRKNKITIYVSCDDFWGSPQLVLEEYFHVLEQWNTGRLTKLKYFIDWIKRGYEENKFEVEARGFAERRYKELEACLAEP